MRTQLIPSRLISAAMALTMLMVFSTAVMAAKFQTLSWDDLLPKSDLEALTNPPAYLADIVDGEEGDKISNGVAKALSLANDDPYQRALVSTKVIKKFNKKAVRVPGFIVPLTFNAKKQATSFFLVPYFGACIHMPPPPPNQTVYIKYPKGLTVDLYQPYWLSGILHTTIVENEMATSAYSLSLKKVAKYDGDDY